MWRRLEYDGGVGDHGSEGLRMEGERWWITSSHLGRERLLEWASLLQQATETQKEELGIIRWGIAGLQEAAMTSTILTQMTITSDLYEDAGALETNTHTEGLLERRIVWGEGP